MKRTVTRSDLPVYDFEASKVPEEQILFLMESARRINMHSLYGYKVYLVGCALRDLYLGGVVNDLDIYIHADHYRRLPSSWQPLGEYTGEITEKPKYPSTASKYRVRHFEPSSSKPGWRPVDLIIYKGSLEEYISSFDFGINQIWWDFEGAVETDVFQRSLTPPGQALHVNNRFNASLSRAEGLCGKYAHLGFKHDLIDGSAPLTRYYTYSVRTPSSVIWTDGDLCEHTR